MPTNNTSNGGNNNPFLDPSIVDLTNSTDEDEIQPSSSKRRKNTYGGPYWSKHPEEEATYADWKLMVYYKLHSRDEDSIKPDSTKSLFDENNETVISKDDSIREEQVASYSVHRNILGTKSDYFHNVFHSNFAESRSSCSKLKLPDMGNLVTLEDFETFLDWIYFGKIDLEPANTAGMLYLSDYYRIESLHSRTEAYTRNHLATIALNFDQDMDTSFLEIYYRTAKTMNNEDLLQAIAHVCYCNPEIMSDSHFLMKLDVDIWKVIFRFMNKNRAQNNTTSSSSSKSKVKMWSIHFAQFCDQFPDKIDYEDFKLLTSKEWLPEIAAEAAASFLDHEMRLLTLTPTGEDATLPNKNLVEINSQKRMTLFQKKCLSSLYDSETGLCSIRDPKVLEKHVHNFPRAVLTSYMLESFAHNSIAQREPTSIRVTESELGRGCYRLSGYDTDLKSYIFHQYCAYNGRPQCMFRLSKHQSTENEKNYFWFISVLLSTRGRNDDDGDDDDDNSSSSSNSLSVEDEEVDLYHATTSRRSNLPPYYGWKIHEDSPIDSESGNCLPLLDYSKTEMAAQIRLLGI